jgi:hypothetical protein
MCRPGGVIQTIKAKCPWLRVERSYNQQDGASPHTGGNRTEVLNGVLRNSGLNMKMITQPAQSPDLNKLR